MFIKYGTNDKVQAAAILFSFLLLPIVILCVLFSIFKGSCDILDSILDWIKYVFIMGFGAVIGRSSCDNGKN